MKSIVLSLSSVFCCVLVVRSQEHADNYQTNWEDYYNHVEHQPVTSTNNKQEFLNFLSQYAIKNKQDLFGGLADMDMPMVAMGTSAVAGVIAAASLAYALTLESRLIALNADKSSLCTTVKAFTSLTRTAATGTSASQAVGTDSSLTANTVEGRNYAFLTSFTSVSAPTCS